MSRLGVLYAITEEELEVLTQQKEEDMYDYMLEEIEERYLSSDRGYELDKSWEGLQYCFGSGVWCERNELPYNIIFGGELLLDDEECIISIKGKEDVRKIAKYLEENRIEKILEENMKKIDEEVLNIELDEAYLNYLLDWCKNLEDFYKNAAREDMYVIFTVDL